MEELIRQLFENTQGLAAYGTVFGVLLVCGLGLPLPEDISLILGGYLAHLGHAQLPVMMAVGFAGILAGDSIAFFAGRRVRSRMGQGRGGLLGRLISPEKRARVQGLFARHGQKIVIIARFLPGVRAMTYFTAGSAGMGYGRFILFDGVAALASAPIFVFLGYHFGGELETLIDGVRRGQARVFLAVGALTAAYLAVKLLRRRRAQEKPLAALPLAVVQPVRPPSPEPPAEKSELTSLASGDDRGRSFSSPRVSAFK